MIFFILMPVVLSFLLLAAHFYRAGELVLVGISLSFMALPLARRTWVPRLLQAGLVLGAIEWLWTLWVIAEARIGYGLPWARMSAILGAVALFTVLSSLVFLGGKVKERYGQAGAK
jgi:hypothetical protein